MEKNTKLKSEVSWGIIATIKRRNGTWSGLLDTCTASTRKRAIENFVEWYGHTWEVAKKNGYQCVKLHINYLITIQPTDHA